MEENLKNEVEAIVQRELTGSEAEQNEFEDKFKDKYGVTLEEAVMNRFKNDNLSKIRNIYEYSKKNNLTVEEIRTEIKEKKCRLTAMTRNFAIGFKADVIEKWIGELYGEKKIVRKDESKD